MRRPVRVAAALHVSEGDLGRRAAAANLIAQTTALALVALASLVVARVGGASVLGTWTLLRVLPWLTGVICSCGVPVASAFVLSGARGEDPRVRPTLSLLVLGGTVVGAAAWVLLTPLLHALFLEQVPGRLLLLMGVTVVTQLWTVWAKACCQGQADMAGANLVIVGEEVAFLPAFIATLAAGGSSLTAVAAGLVAAGVCSTAIGLSRLARRGFFSRWATPSGPLARSVLGYGARAQLGNLLWLVNLRLDLLMLGALAGPATLGVYAVASKSAELMRLPATAANYVLYPRFARLNPPAAAVEVRTLLPRACGLTIAAAPVLAAASAVGLPLLFGAEFRAAVLPACVLLVGLAVEGAAAVSTAYLCGIGRPGANSAGMALGVVVTIALDVALIPRHGALGAATASSVAYLSAAGLLTYMALRISARVAPAPVTALKKETS